MVHVNHQRIICASVDGLSRALDNSKSLPLDGTEDRSLYEDQNSSVFNAISHDTSGGQALAIICTHDKEQDSRDLY